MRASLASIDRKRLCFEAHPAHLSCIFQLDRKFDIERFTFVNRLLGKDLYRLPIIFVDAFKQGAPILIRMAVVQIEHPSEFLRPT